MKTSALLAIAAAATARATGPSDKTKFNCAKPNANYCLASDIILRCDANSVGTPGRCSDNVSGYPPQGGIADCYESAQGAGDAACVKNCVVYAQPSFTLPADKCTPSYTPTASSAVDKPTKSYAVPSSETGIMSIPEGTSLGTPYPPPPPYTHPHHHHNHSSVLTSMTNPIYTKTETETETEPGSCATGTGHPSVPPCHAGSSTGGGGTGAPHMPTTPSTTGKPPTVPTAAAPANRAAGLLAAAGVAAAYLL